MVFMKLARRIFLSGEGRSKDVLSGYWGRRIPSLPFDFASAVVIGISGNAERLKQMAYDEMSYDLRYYELWNAWQSALVIHRTADRFGWVWWRFLAPRHVMVVLIRSGIALG